MLNLRFCESGEVGVLKGLVQEVDEDRADDELVVQVDADLGQRYLIYND